MEDVINFGGRDILGFSKGRLINSEFANGFFHFSSMKTPKYQELSKFAIVGGLATS